MSLVLDDFYVYRTILICIPCQQCVWSNRVALHLKNSNHPDHPNYTTTERQNIQAEIDTLWPQLLAYPPDPATTLDDIVGNPARQIPYLPVREDGLQCERCPYACLQESSMRKHNCHGFFGIPKWKTYIPVQQLFPSQMFKSFFAIIQKEEEMEYASNAAESFETQMKDCDEAVIAELSLASSIITISPVDQQCNFVQRAEWEHMFNGWPRADLMNACAIPSIAERRMGQIVPAVVTNCMISLVVKCAHKVCSSSSMLRMELGRTTTEPSTSPFRVPTPITIEKYAKICTSTLLFILRIREEPDSDKLIRLTKVQTELLDRFKQAVFEQMNEVQVRIVRST